MFAGIVSLNKKSFDDRSVNEIKNVFPADSELEIIQNKRENSFFIRASTKALSEYSGVINDEIGSFSLMAGEPLLTQSGIENDHIALTIALRDCKYEDFSDVRGVFCLASFQDSEEPELVLCADKLGIRPLYYWTDGDCVIFSTALKVLEAVSMIPQDADRLALSERYAFGVPLASRTKYKHIKILRESEVVRFAAAKCESTTYWQWDEIEQINITKEEAAAKVFELFKGSIRLRLNNDSCALSYLSGGMDSRAIVSVLNELCDQVHVFNFSDEGQQDTTFAREFAKKINCSFHEKPTPEKPLAQMTMPKMAASVKQISEQAKIKTTRPKTIWSGDGGSVGLGCVYLNKQIVEKFRYADKKVAIQYFREKNIHGLPLRFMRKDRQNEMSTLLDNTISEELNRINCSDKGQQIFLFLMFNDQRRHLHSLYENIDQHATEYQLPFFDSKLLEFIFSIPVDYRLNHELYHEIFKLFPSSVTSVPWQTYPEHVPCPLPIDSRLTYQWKRSPVPFSYKFKKQMREGIEGIKLGLHSKGLDPLCRYKFLLATVLHLLSLRNYGYIISAGKIYSLNNKK
ncbi:asparagine synthase-related protein [Pelovirga terrestris]|uniref:asparagine synthase (glutamine-hydrolyzing) n=1 Tax=Pelovirga terrestris TaxID=2771352 RepID=A0A8J6QLJ5_9BACT|nr:asparagine synthase-related protein [Pelovirga terrestris]MBD1399352.1 hypothetical protein [Pelovirga terrestris]